MERFSAVLPRLRVGFVCVACNAFSRRRVGPVFLSILISWMASVVGAEWQPAKGPLMTRWAKDASPDKAHPEYPRPLLVREHWRSLNGLWEYAIRPKAEGEPRESDGRILVPFPVESALSGVMKTVGDKNRLWYRRTFEVPTDEAWRGEDKRVRLHFGAVDWEATVWINGKRLGETWMNGIQYGSHLGGYDPFTLDITSALKPGKLQEIVVAVWDPSDAGYQPRGKQVAKPGGIWYTPVTGIWQTVWIEPVPFYGAIGGIAVTPNVDKGTVTVRPGYSVRGGNEVVTVEVLDGDKVVGKASSPPGEIVAGFASSQAVEVPIEKPKLWTPDSPFLYDLRVKLSRGGKLLDEVRSYCGMRKVSIAKDSAGVNRIMLNNRPLFMCGPLDQGWWPDGLYTAPTDEALRYDIEMTKKLGFNMCRKHVKVEPERWYYWCDKLGLMVWQDMPNGDRHISGAQPDIERSADSEANFRREWQAIIRSRHSHPSIVAWVPFNEGWGQFKTNEILKWTKELDPSRLVDGPSGWTDRGGGDMRDLHDYPGPGMPPLEEKRASVLGEFGGLGLPLAGHLWLDKGNWGYRTFKNREELTAAYRQLTERLRWLQAEGLSAAVYTQTTDVEVEVNGLMTYDRAVVKVPEDVANLHKQLYGPPPRLRTLVATSQTEPQTWKYTTAKPAEGWFKADFDDAAWSSGPGGFGTKGTPGAIVRTEWKTGDIWLRRTFDLKTTDVHGLALRIHHDEDAEVYLNGEKVFKVGGYTVNYTVVPLLEKALKALRTGKNTLAVHCQQTTGGQYIDVGLVELIFTKDSEP